MIALGVVASVMMLRTTNLLWMLLPKLRFVQFPWRLMMVLAVVFAVFVAAAARRAFLFSLIAMALSLSLTGAYLVKHTWWDTEDVDTVKEAMDSKAGFEGTDEYDPLGDDHTDVPQQQPETKVIVEKGERYHTMYRPLIVGQVVIKPGVRTILNITMHPGDTLERVGAPQMVTQQIALDAT